jgi:FdhD protein
MMNTEELDLASTILEKLKVDRWKNFSHSTSEDLVAVETPVAIEYNGISHAVMLASPANLKDFALGFSLTEGIIKHVDEMYDCEVEHQQDGIVVKVAISSKRFVELKDRRRNLTGRTGCGLCGVETIEQAVRHHEPVIHRNLVSEPLLSQGMQKMQDLQPMHKSCGATHAAAWMDLDGQIICVREDVGRHNALDKLIGNLSYWGHDFSQGVALITSRASYEMVQKCAAMNIGFIAAISAPTSLAARLAKDSGVTLVGYMREQSYVAYSHPERIAKE